MVRLPMRDYQGNASPDEGPSCPARGRKTAPSGAGEAGILNPSLLRVLEGLPLGLAVIDGQDRVRFINQRARSMIGYNRRDVPDVKTWLERALADPDQRGKAAAIWVADKRGGQSVRRMQVRTGDGKRRFMEVRQQAWDKENRLITILDLTARQHTERALKQSEERFARLFLSNPSAVVITTLDEGRIIDMNDAFGDLTGYTREECLGRTTREAGFWEDPGERQRFARALSKSQGHLLNYETRAAVKGRRGLSMLISAEVVEIDGRDCVIAVCRDVTEQRSMQEALRQSEAQFRTLTETADCGIFIIQGSRFVYMNPAGVRITGYELDQLYAMEFWEVVHPDFREMVRLRGLARQRGEDIPNHYEFKLLRADGCERWVDFAAGFLDHQGQPAMLGTAFDITERKQAEELLRLDEERLEVLVELGQMHQDPPKAVMRYAMEEAVRLTRSAVGYLGFMSEDETAMTIKIRSADSLKGCQVSARPVVYELRNIGLWGEAVRQRRPVITNDYPASPLKKGLPEGHIPITRHMNLPIFEGSRIVAVAGVGNKREPYDESDVRQVNLLMDAMWKILQHQHAQEALRQSEERFRSVAENAPDIIFTLDRRGALTYVNPAWERILGFKPAQVLGRAFVEFAQSEAAKDMAHSFRLIRDERKTMAGVNGILLDRQGRPRHFIMSGGPNLDPSGQVVGMVGLLKDVSGQIALEAQLRHAQKMEAVGTLAGGVAHEFNNALMAIRGYSQLLALNTEKGGAAGDLLAKIDLGCQRAAELTNKMLTFTRMESGDKSAVEINLVAREVWGVIRQTLPPRIELVMELDEGLPPALGNAQQLEQVLLNLVLNARDASRPGDRITVATSLVELDEEFAESHPWASPGPYLTMEVSDTGEGMPQEIQERVFDPFFTTKEPGRGTGLGLSVAYSIVKSHQGHIALRSQPGQGSVFTVYLPRAETREVFRPAAAPLPEVPAGRGEDILVVDDEAQLREIADEMLTMLGYRVAQAADGREALMKYRAALEEGSPFRLVLLDLAMPVMDGRECLERLLELDPAARVLVTTGHGGDPNERDRLLKDTLGILRKPYDMTQLLTMIRQALDA